MAVPFILLGGAALAGRPWQVGNVDQPRQHAFARQQLLQPPLVHAPRLDEIAPVVAAGIREQNMDINMFTQRF